MAEQRTHSPHPAWMSRLQAVADCLAGTLQRPAQPSVAELDAVSEQACTDLLEGRIEDALPAYGLLVSREPGRPEHHFGLGLCLQQIGEVHDAGVHFTLALSLNPADAACAYRLGECMAALGYPEEARDAFNMALALCQSACQTAGLGPLTDLIHRALTDLH